MVDGQAAIGIPVVRDPDIGAVLENSLREIRQMRRTDAGVDVESVWICADDGHSCPGIREHLRRDAGGRTVRAVEHHMNAVEPGGQGRQQMQHVAVFCISESTDAPNLDTGRGKRSFAQRSLHPIFDNVWQLRAANGEEFDAVVGCRVVRCRNHDAEIGADIGDQERRCRCRDHSGIEHVYAGARKPGRYGSRNELAGDPRIAGDHRHRTATGCPPAVGESPLAEDDRGRLSQLEGELNRHVSIRETPNSVGTEQTRHNSCNQLLGED